MVTVFVEILKSSVLLYLGFLNIRRYVLYLYIETLKQRLDAINQLRVDRALAAMGPAFQQVYSLLPTLLHYHHPLMPGYLDGNVPRGICLYTPDETQRHYLEELELHRGMQTQEPPKGELPENGDVRQLAQFLNCVLQGMSISAREGADFTRLMQIADTTLRLWPQILQN